MAVYLVDTENTSHWWSTCQSGMKPGDKVILFYTNNSSSLHFPLFDQVSELDIPVQFMKCICGPMNALDFQLVSYLGYLISKDDNQTYYIIANDAGYDAVVSFWQHRGVDILRIMWVRPGCKDIVSGETGVTAVRSDVLQQFNDLKSVKTEFEKLLPENYKSELDVLINIFQDILKASKKNYRAINFRNALTKHYGLQVGSELYNILKPCASSILKSLPDLTISQDSQVSTDSASSVSPENADKGMSGNMPKPTLNATAGQIKKSEPVKQYDYIWDDFVVYVNEQQLCTVYRNSLVHDFKFMTDLLARQVMAVMGYAMMHMTGKRRIESVMAALNHKLPANISDKDMNSLKTRLSRKMSTGSWPSFVKKKLAVSNLPRGL